MSSAGAVVPDGFVSYEAPSAYVRQLGPMYQRREADGRTTLGLWLLDEHANLHGQAHGGMLATVVDNLLGWNIALLAGPIVTAHLSIDFLQAAPVGAWLEGRIEYRRQGRRLIFADALLFADGVCVVRASGILAAVRPQ